MQCGSFERRSGQGADGRAARARGFVFLALLALAGFATAQSPSGRQEPDAETAALVAEERHDADLARRRGKPESALARFREILDEDAGDLAARELAARALADLGRWDEAEREARAVLAATRPDAMEAVHAARRLLVGLLALRGRGAEAVDLARAAPAPLDPADDPRDAAALGRALLEAGRRAEGLAAFGQGARAKAVGWEALLAAARCLHGLGDLAGASQRLVAADEAAVAGDGTEPDVLAALADVYFEADREVAGPTERRSAGKLYSEAQRLDPAHEAASLGAYRLYRYNWQRHRTSAQKILSDFLAARPDSIEGLIAGVSGDLDDGQLKSARERLKRLDELAPKRRAVRTLHAALAWIEHREDECRARLAELVGEDPKDSDPEREVGKHLLELYRFAEGLPFVRAATERDPGDYEAWTQLGRALANTGDEPGALAALSKADEAAGGRQDAWRNNMRTVLKRMAAEHKREGGGDLAFQWNEDAAEIFRTYLVPFYTESRAELAQRYGFTPGPTAIEVFAKHDDFSVRSTGFQGFPALGVCFGPVVTAVSPLSELRGTFSWARTSYHEFTHVIHLGLSHNRCPRWITEGLATWEEVHKNPAWTRNMRRELVDSLANDDLIPVRELNRAFRGPRILFGYYQGGLLCQMLIERNGFPPMVRLLESFDRGADVDQAFQEVFQTSPEAVDRDFRAFVQGLTRELRIEPRWSDAKIARLRATLGRKPPTDASKLAAWADGWCTIAWDAWQEGRKVDAQEALRTFASVAPQPARAQFLRGEMKLKEGDKEGAKALWEAALASGAEDYRVRMALGMLAREAKDDAAAEAHFLAAEKDFPGFDDRALSAELQLAQLYEETERHDLAMQAKERWLVYESGSIAEALEVARWHAEKGRNAEAVKDFEMANEIDPFRWKLHEDWGNALAALARHEEAVREFGVALQVPAALEGDRTGPASEVDRARVLGKRAASELALGRTDDAAEHARAALELDPDGADARAVLERLR